MVKLRLAKPEQLVDLQDLSELRGIRNEGGTLVIGAIAAHLLEVYDDDLEWDVDRFRVTGVPELSKTMTELACATYNNVPPGMEPGLEAVSYNDPPNMTYPFGAYVCVVDVDVDSGVNEIRRFYALDDCGTRLNPMIIEGQVHGGLTEALAIAMEQEWPMTRPAI